MNEAPVAVAPPVVVVDPRCATELGSQHHQRLVQQFFGMEVCRQGSHRLQDRRLTWRPLDVVAVGVPAAKRHLDEPEREHSN